MNVPKSDLEGTIPVFAIRFGVAAALRPLMMDKLWRCQDADRMVNKVDKGLHFNDITWEYYMYPEKTREVDDWEVAIEMQ